MHMGMMQQILTPGVEHSQEADRRAEMGRVGRHLEERGRARTEE